MKKRYIFIVMVLVFSLIFTACSPGNNEQVGEDLEEKDRKIAELEERINELEGNEKEAESNNLLIRVIDAIELIKEKDFNALSEYVHPEKGVRFTPYFYIDTDVDQVFTPEEVAGLMEDEEVYHWGNYDGTGDPIELKFSDYYDRFVYDNDFANPQIIGNNVPIGQGNTLDNVVEAYPNGHFIEFHFKQIDPQYEGMDWSSLRLVFEEMNGVWYLVGIVHGQWTI